MQWSPEQDAALKAVNDWLVNKNDQVFRLFGYAGTGKTTLARHIAEHVDGRVLFGAYTGKAAHVLRTKGCPGASTIHSMIYRPKNKSEARLKAMELELATLLGALREQWPDAPQDVLDSRPDVTKLRWVIEEERKHLARPSFDLNEEASIYGADLIIIDECSMVDGRMADDLLSFKIPVLVLGDPGQLPPVGGGGFFTEAKPDFMLTEIHRQARDNPIIDLASRVREENDLSVGDYGESKVIFKNQVTTETTLEADQLLVGKNATRHSFNKRMRQLKGFELPGPMPHDKLVCLRNNHDVGLLNGSIWDVVGVSDYDEELAVMSVKSQDTGIQLECNAWMAYFLGHDLKGEWFRRKEAEEFDFGYALTVHKAQGSQWDNVILFDESFVFRKDRWRWLYTGITRAASKVTIVKM